MIDILSPDFHQNPYAHYKTIRDEYPLFFHEKTGMYILSRYDDVTAASNNPAFSTRHYEQNFEPLAGERIVLTMEGKEHTVKRNFISNPIRGRELEEKMLPAIKRIAEELFDAFPNKQDVDFVKDFTAKFPVNVIVAVLELPPSDYPLFHDWYSRMSAYFTNISKDPAIIADGELLVKEMEAYLAPIIEERKRNPGTDVISLMCTTEQYSSMTTNKEIQAVCATYLSAGGDTTDKTLRSLLVNLLNHPEQLEMVRKDRSLVNNAIAETLRFSPPLHMLLRLTIEDIETPHGVIPKGSMVNTLLGAANRDDRKFENPDSFNILRTDLNIKNAFSGAANHTTFGSGRHFCAGAMLAAAEMNIALNLFLDRTESIELLNEIEEEGIFIRAPKAVRLALHLKSEKNGGEETAIAPSAPPPQCPFHGSHSN